MKSKKIAIISDVHVGCRNDSQAFIELFRKFFETVFFPYLDKHNIKTVLCLGDLFDRRKYINFNSLNAAHNMFFKQIAKRKIEFISVVGNHDSYYRTTTEVNSIDLLLDGYKNVNIISEKPKVERFFDTDVLLIPWITPQEMESALDVIKKSHAQIAMGHLEINGFEMYSGSPLSDHGLETSTFSGFDIVLSGHFHKKSQRGNIHYLGAPYEMTWADYKDKKGFHVFDFETRTLEFIENPIRMFHKLVYNDRDFSITEIEKKIKNNEALYEGSFVKVIVQTRENLYNFDRMIDLIQKCNPANLQVVEDHHNNQLISDDVIAENVDDTLTTLTKVVETLEIDNSYDKDHLKNVIHALYMEAVALETC